jgi:hypothetical protein
MRNSSFTILFGDDSDDITGEAIDFGQIFAASFQYIFGDTDAEGSLKIEGSCDPVPKGTLMPFVPSNWNAISGGTIAITAGGTGVVQIAPIAYRFIRVTWTHTTPGTSTLTVNVNVQGV